MELVFKREIVSSKLACRASAAVVFLAFMCLGAFVRIPLPFTPVPLTLQTFFVLLSGAFLGRNWAFLTQAGYILLGAAGIPVFAEAGSGLTYLLGPTAGYLFGFVLAAFFAGTFIKGQAQDWRIVAGILAAADGILLATGTLWLKFFLGCGIREAFFMGTLPFIAGDACKVACAALVYNTLKKRIREIL